MRVGLVRDTDGRGYVHCQKFDVEERKHVADYGTQLYGASGNAMPPESDIKVRAQPSHLRARAVGKQPAS